MAASHTTVHPLEVDEEVEAPPQGAIQPPAGVVMHSLPVAPGTRWSCGLRVAQLIFAGIAAAVMWSAVDFTSSAPGFLALVPAFIIQGLWSLILAGVDGYALLVKRSLRQRRRVIWLAAGDLIIGATSFAAACGAAGVTMFMDDNKGLCLEHGCAVYKAAVAMAFFSCFAVAPTFAVNMLLVV
ncbi:hypothetical protein EJB05_50317, partial [Eragrostis curvula]